MHKWRYSGHVSPLRNRVTTHIVKSVEDKWCVADGEGSLTMYINELRVSMLTEVTMTNAKKLLGESWKVDNNA